MLKLEQRFKKDDGLKNNYFKFMGEFLDQGHAVIVDPSDDECEGTCVINHTFRVVFDCSAKFQGISVNDFLYKGPIMRNSLVVVLMRFRTHIHALISDIRKLYYQCVVKKNDQDFLRFLWYKDKDFNKPIIEHKMTR